MKKPLFAALLLLCFSSCKKGESANTNSDVADSYVGNYRVTDTFGYFDPATGTVNTKNSIVNGSVSRLSANTILFNGMFVCNKLSATATGTSVSLLANSSCTGPDAPLGFKGRREGTTIYYTYTSEFDSSETLVPHYGKAEKLP